MIGKVCPHVLRAGTWVALLLAASSCGVGPAYRRPDIQPPAHWKQSSGDEAADSDASASQSSAASKATPSATAVGAWPARDWWRHFGSAQLDAYVAAAEQSNDDLHAAMARVREADAQVRIAGGTLLPSVDASATASRSRAQVSGGGPRMVTLFEPQISASYVLDFWGKNVATFNATRATARASRFDEQTVALTVVSSVANSYFQILELRDRIEVARQNLANGERVLSGLRLQQEAGIATGLDVAQQQTTVELLHAAIPPLVQQLRQTVFALAVLLGKSPEAIDVDEGSLAAITLPPVIEGLPAELLARRPDVAEAEQNLVAANADITVARAALFPNIALTASGGYESAQLKNLISPATRVYSVAAGLTQPIFHSGALHAQVTYSRARYEELLSNYHKAVLSAFGNVESALVSVQQVAEQERRQRQAVNTAQRAYEFAQKQMSAGTANILNVLNTENALFSAQDELVQVQFLRLQSMINLYTALGGGWRQG
jgi:NodT family efflux transporter outer membrane factor (OMF) lipoprotein